jgi:PhnB protein
MASINPHINFNGNAEEAFNFYKSVFGGEFAKIMRFKDLASAEFPVAENEANKNNAHCLTHWQKYFNG